MIDVNAGSLAGCSLTPPITRLTKSDSMQQELNYSGSAAAQHHKQDCNPQEMENTETKCNLVLAIEPLPYNYLDYHSFLDAQQLVATSYCAFHSCTEN